MSLYQEIRPRKFAEIVGNSAVIGALEVLLKKSSENRPHFMLLKGPNGCGKTTIARILAKAFGSSDDSVIKIHANNTNGIDTVREIGRNAPLMGLGGGAKTYIIDECFLGKTRILVDYDKSLPIKDIVELENITEVLSYDIESKKIVKKKIIRKIKNPLISYMCKTFISDKGKIYQIDSTRTHKFYVLGKGYTIAEKLKPGDKLIKYNGEFSNSYRCSKCDNVFISYEEFTHHKLSYHSPWKGINLHIGGDCKYCGKSFKYVRTHEYWAHEANEDEKKVKRLNQSVSKRRFLESDAAKEYCQNISNRQRGRSCSNFVAYNKRRWAELSDSEKEAQIKRFMAAPRYRNSPNNPEKLIISMDINGLRYAGDGSFFLSMVLNGKKRKKNPDFVVNGEIEVDKIISAKKFVEVMDLEYWHRDDWKDIQKAYQKAGFEILILDARRVVEDTINVKAELEAFVNNCYVEIVEPPLSKSGRKKNSRVNFKSKGVEFVYNLEIEDTHNYFALAPSDDSVLRNRYNDKNCLPILVSNSHELTTKAQDGFLDLLEDNPPHCYFIFCTTDPERIIKGIRNRGPEYSVELLQDNELVQVLKRACKKKNLDVSQDIIDAVVYTCDGSPRAALVALEQVIGIENIDEAIELLVSGSERDASVLDLLLLLIMAPSVRRKKWKKIITTFDAIQEDSERIRRAILTFLYNKLKKQSDVEDALDITHLLKIFSENTFYGKKSQLGALIARACFETWSDNFVKKEDM